MVVRLDESGQSVVEFLIMLPMMIGLVVILVRVNSAIQMSIVNQQYARSTATWLTFNSPVYPQRKFVMADFTPFNSSRMVVGVAENQIGVDDSGAQPEASTQQVTRGRRKPGGTDSNSDKQNLRERELVRVRTTVALCTQVNSIELDGKKMPLIGNALAENSRFDFCRSAQDE
jgi:hypothetical protein